LGTPHSHQYTDGQKSGRPSPNACCPKHDFEIGPKTSAITGTHATNRRNREHRITREFLRHARARKDGLLRQWTDMGGPTAPTQGLLLATSCEVPVMIQTFCAMLFACRLSVLP